MFGGGGRLNRFDGQDVAQMFVAPEFEVGLCVSLMLDLLDIDRVRPRGMPQSLR